MFFQHPSKDKQPSKQFLVIPGNGFGNFVLADVGLGTKAFPIWITPECRHLGWLNSFVEKGSDFGLEPQTSKFIGLLTCTLTSLPHHQPGLLVTPCVPVHSYQPEIYRKQYLIIYIISVKGNFLHLQSKNIGN